MESIERPLKKTLSGVWGQWDRRGLHKGHERVAIVKCMTCKVQSASEVVRARLVRAQMRHNVNTWLMSRGLVPV